MRQDLKRITLLFLWAFIVCAPLKLGSWITGYQVSIPVFFCWMALATWKADTIVPVLMSIFPPIRWWVEWTAR